jgi:hypothetical protein
MQMQALWSVEAEPQLPVPAIFATKHRGHGPPCRERFYS